MILRLFLVRAKEVRAGRVAKDGMTDSIALTGDRLRALRAGAQLLHRPQPRLLVDELVQRLCGVQAQDFSAAELAVRARTTNLTASSVDRARTSERSVVWTWAMRGTLHLIAADDLGWLLPLVAPSSFPGSRRRLAQLGVGGDAPAKAVRMISKLLAGEGPLTRGEIAERLARHGIRTEGQAAVHLVRLAALEGVICMGPNRGRERSFVLLRDWIRPQRALAREEALTELARRYLAAYGPAELGDFATWSGLGLTDARIAWGRIARDLREIRIDGLTLWALRSQNVRQAPRAVVRLVPNFDPYLLGYRSRDFAVPRQYARKVHPGGGMLRPVVLADGQAVGTWHFERRASKICIMIQMFTKLDPKIKDALDPEAHDIGRFLGVSTELVIS